MRKNKMGIIIEELSHIDLQVDDDNYVLWDRLNDQKFKINKTTYEICLVIDGKRTLEEITLIIAEKYNITFDEAMEDVYNLVIFLKENKLILCNGTVKYKLIKFYNKLVFADRIG